MRARRTNPPSHQRRPLRPFDRYLQERGRADKCVKLFHRRINLGICRANCKNPTCASRNPARRSSLQSFRAFCNNRYPYGCRILLILASQQHDHRRFCTEYTRSISARLAWEASAQISRVSLLRISLAPVAFFAAYPFGICIVEGGGGRGRTRLDLYTPSALTLGTCVTSRPTWVVGCHGI